jgi:antitoxin CptB
MDERRKKLRFRAWRRGFREIDLILGRFADAHLAGLDEAGLDAFEALLDAPDGLVYDWIAGLASAPREFDTPTLAALGAFASSSADFRLVGASRAGALGPDSPPQGGGGCAIDPLAEQSRSPASRTL